MLSLLIVALILESRSWACSLGQRLEKKCVSAAGKFVDRCGMVVPGRNGK